MTPLEHLEQRLRDGDADAVLRFADPERAIVEAGRLLTADPAVRREFDNNAQVLGSYLASIGAPHVERVRRLARREAEARADRDAAAHEARRAQVPRGAKLSAATATDDWGDSAAVGKALGLGAEFAASVRGRAALRRAGVRTRRANGHDEWHLGDALTAKSRVGATGLLQDAGGGVVAGWC